MSRKKHIDPKDLMAVERTTTALLSTSISLIVLGFVIEKFELFLYLLTVQNDPEKSGTLKLSHVEFYKYLSIIVVIAGILLALYTFRYYTRWLKHLNHDEIETDKNIFFILAVFIAIIGAFLMMSMFFI